MLLDNFRPTIRGDFGKPGSFNHFHLSNNLQRVWQKPDQAISSVAPPRPGPVRSPADPPSWRAIPFPQNLLRQAPQDIRDYDNTTRWTAGFLPDFFGDDEGLAAFNRKPPSSENTTLVPERMQGPALL